jgi:hypothetical protein
MLFTEKIFKNKESNNKITIETKKKLILDTVDLIENSEVFFESYGTNYRKIEIHGNSIFIKYNERKYNVLLGEIFRDLKLKNNFSKEYVDEFISDLVTEIFEKGLDKVEKDPLMADIFEDTFYESIVYIPLDGIKMEKQLLTVGKINLREFTQKDADFHIQNISYLMAINPHYTNKRANGIVELEKERISRLIGVCAEFQVYADPKKAIDLAEKECEKVLDLFRWTVSYIHHRNHNVYIGMKGEIPRSSRETLVAKTDFRSYHHRSQIIGAKYKFEINDKNISTMRRNGFFKISNILKKPNNNIKPFENSLLTAIHWFADSQTQKELGNEILSLVICLEVFLSPSNEESITSFISEAIAIILADKEHKEELKTDVKHFYDIRSKIVHEGLIPSDDEENGYLRTVVKHLIFQMIKEKDNIPSQDILVKHIADEKNKQKLNVELNLKKLKGIDS